MTFPFFRSLRMTRRHGKTADAKHLARIRETVSAIDAAKNHAGDALPYLWPSDGAGRIVSLDSAAMMDDDQWRAKAAAQQCQKPPAGYRCTRASGHTGPCAAIPSDYDASLQVERAASSPERCLAEMGDRTPTRDYGDWVLIHFETIRDALQRETRARKMLAHCRTAAFMHNLKHLAAEIDVFLKTGDRP